MSYRLFDSLSFKVVTFSFRVRWIFQSLDKNKNDSDYYLFGGVWKSDR